MQEISKENPSKNLSKTLSKTLMIFTILNPQHIEKYLWYSAKKHEKRHDHFSATNYSSISNKNQKISNKLYKKDIFYVHHTMKNV